MKRKYKVGAVIILIIGAISLIPQEDTSLKINIVGSNSIQPICEQLVEEYEKTHKNVDINVQGGGSSLGIRCSNSSIADIGMSSKEIECDNLKEYELGKEAIVIIANNKNSINDLTTDQIRNIFSGKIKDWGEISNQSGKINIIIREEGSGTLDSFKDIIMKNQSIKNDAIVQNSPGGVKQTVIQDENAIGFTSLVHIDSKIKSISIDGVYPRDETIGDGSYKLQRPFILLTDNTPNQQTKEFIDWALSNQSQDILESEKIIRAD